MWGTDATATHTVHDGPVTVFVAVDHCAWLAQRHRHRSPAQVRRELMPRPDAA